MHSNNTYKPDSNYVVFAGRLTESKGIEELIEAWNDVGFNDLSLKVLGDGELYTELTSKYINKNIEFTGELSNEKVVEQIRNSKAVLTATKMYEGHPRLLSEASICGVLLFIHHLVAWMNIFLKITLILLSNTIMKASKIV